MLRLALENLRGNAWMFTADRQPAEIRVTAKWNDSETELVIADNGTGFLALWKYMQDIMKVIGVCAMLGLALSFVR